MSQVGTFLAYTNGSVWTWVDGELYLPKDWFTAEKAELREKLGIPAEREFKTKIELGWEMIQRAHANWAYQRLNLTDVVQNQSRVLSPDRPLKVSEVAHREDTNWRRVRVRSTERGELNDEFAAIWTIHEDKPVQEWLVIRRESNGRCTYSLSNATPNTHLKRLAWLKCQRYFVERANQDAKTELGWDELEAQKYLAWMHHLYHSRYVVHHADKNRVGGAVRSRPRSIAAVRGGSVTGVVHRQCIYCVLPCRCHS